MKTIYFVSLGDDDTEGFVTPEGELLGAWYPNDAGWRGEYLDYIFEKLGIEIKYAWSDPMDPKALKKAKAAMRKACG